MTQTTLEQAPTVRVMFGGAVMLARRVKEKVLRCGLGLSCRCTGANMEFRPSMQFRRLAHAAIGMGWKILFGHSAHVFQGIEIYRGCPIIYAAGDLVDDYHVGPEFKNDHQLLFEMELSRSALRHIYLHPVFIEDCRTLLAAEEQSDYIVTWMTAICKEIGARVQQDGERYGSLEWMHDGWVQVISGFSGDNLIFARGEITP